MASSRFTQSIGMYIHASLNDGYILRNALLGDFVVVWTS